jgi:hypothetical protein
MSGNMGLRALVGARLIPSPSFVAGRGAVGECE